MKKDKVIDMALAIAGIMLVGIGIAFISSAGLGNDAIGMMYDGIRCALNLSPEQLGNASNIVNLVLALTVLLLNRHYINIGTVIYVLPYGKMVDLGGKLYHTIFNSQTLSIQIVGATMGCCLLYFGVAMFIVADIGLDPFTGFVMVLRDKLKREYKYVKIFFDIACVVIGFSLGGRLGVITIITSLFAGPTIQFFTMNIKKVTKKV